MKKLIIAHRGASSLAPENTLAAFQKAMDCGADMTELDVRRSKDKQLMVIHDKKLAGENLSKLTSAQIKKINPNIPTLQEVLALVKGNILLDVELKESGYETEVLDELLQYLSADDFVITSFIQRSLKIVKKKYPQVKIGLLIPEVKNKFTSRIKDFFFFDKKNLETPDFFAPHFSRLNEAKRLGNKPLYVWTVNKAANMESCLFDNRIAGIITNFPQLAPKHPAN